MTVWKCACAYTWAHVVLVTFLALMFSLNDELWKLLLFYSCKMSCSYKNAFSICA